MGYAYGRNAATGRYMLSCDGCGTMGGVKKRKCPVNYDPAPALCQACLVKEGGIKKIHAGCREKSATYHAKREAFRNAHINDYVTLAAWGGSQDVVIEERAGMTFHVLEGQVLVFAGLGGRLSNYQYPEKLAYFVVPAGEYSYRGEDSFVIDQTKHELVWKN